MQQFKVGDWVRLKDKDFNAIFQIELIDEYGNFFDKNQLYRGEQKYWEIWQPKEGEWCWFWDKDEVPVLRQSTGDIGTGAYRFKSYNIFHKSISQWNNCEPFLGELPTFLKDIK